MSALRLGSAVVIVVLLAVASGCGFQLRGETTFPPQMSRIYIVAEDRYTPFYRELTDAIRASDAQLVGDPLSANTIFRIQRDATGRRALSVSIRNIPREYEVYYSVEYAVILNSIEVLAPQTHTLTRDYTYDETVVLGKEREEQVLRDAIAADLVGLVQQRLGALRSQTAAPE